MKTIKIAWIVPLAAAVLLAFQGCEKMEDTYSKHLEQGEIIYPGKADLLQALPGNKRIGLKWVVLSDPKVSKALIYWNNKADSLQVPMSGNRRPDTISVVLPQLPEGLYTFDVYNFDQAGHRSIGTQVTGEVFGESYQQAISNRLVRLMEFLNLPKQGEIPAFKGGQVTWYGLSAQAVFMDITYTKEDGSTATIREEPVRVAGRLPLFRETTRLPSWKQNTQISYRTAFMPDAAAIDTFYTQPSIYKPK